MNESDRPVLAIETAVTTGGVALVTPGRVIAERLLDVRVTYSERLLPSIEAMMSEAGVGFADLRGIAVSAGPGSFTGLRIGIATAQGLALPTGLPLVAVGTLEALAWSVWGPRALVAVALDARRGEVYGAAYRVTGDGLAEVVAPAALAPAAFAETLREHAAGGVLAGPGAGLVAPHLGAAEAARGEGPSWVTAPAHLRAPRPASVGVLGLVALASGRSVPPEKLTACYLRPAAARVPAGGPS